MFNCFGKSKKNEILPQGNSKELIKSLGKISQEVKNLNQSLQNLNSEKQTKTTIRYNIVNTYLPTFTLVSFLLGGAITFSYLKEIDALEYFHTSLSLEQFALTTIIISLYLLFIFITILAPTIKTFMVFNNTTTINNKEIKERHFIFVANTLLFISTPLAIFFFLSNITLWLGVVMALSVIFNLCDRFNKVIDTNTTFILCIIDIFTYLFMLFSIIFLTGKTIDYISNKDLLYSYLTIVSIGSIANIGYYLSIVRNKKSPSKDIENNFKPIIFMAVVLFISLIIQPWYPLKTSELAFRAIGVRDVFPKKYLIDNEFLTKDLGVNCINASDKYFVKTGMVVWRDKDITLFVKEGDEAKMHIAIPSDKIKKYTPQIYSVKNKKCNPDLQDLLYITKSINHLLLKTN